MSAGVKRLLTRTSESRSTRPKTGSGGWPTTPEVTHPPGRHDEQCGSGHKGPPAVAARCTSGSVPSGQCL